MSEKLVVQVERLTYDSLEEPVCPNCKSGLKEARVSIEGWPIRSTVYICLGCDRNWLHIASVP